MWNGCSLGSQGHNLKVSRGQNNGWIVWISAELTDGFIYFQWLLEHIDWTEAVHRYSFKVHLTSAVRFKTLFISQNVVCRLKESKSLKIRQTNSTFCLRRSYRKHVRHFVFLKSDSQECVHLSPLPVNSSRLTAPTTDLQYRRMITQHMLKHTCFRSMCCCSGGLLPPGVALESIREEEERLTHKYRYFFMWLQANALIYFRW